MFDISQGKERARAWPRKRGTKISHEQAEQMEWFRQAQWATKYMAPSQLEWAMVVTENSPLLPRDILTMMMAGRLAMFVLDDGRRLYPMPFKNDVSESLDAIGQTEGYILQRQASGWEAIPLPSASRIGCILTRTTQQTAPVSLPYTPVQWTAAIRDDLAFWNPMDPTYVTIPREGWYDVYFHLMTDGGSGSTRRMEITQNGTRISRQVEYNVSSSTDADVILSMCWFFDEGDIISANFNSSSSGGRATDFQLVVTGG